MKGNQMASDPFKGSVGDESTTPLRVLYHGDPGKAKSTNALAAANQGRLVMVDAERRFKPAALRRQGVNSANVERFTNTGYQFLLDLADHLQDRFDNEEEDAPFAVVIDSIPELHRLLLEDVVDKQVARATANGMERDNYKVFLEDHGDVSEQMRRLIRAFHSLPCHLIFTAISKRDTNEDDQLVVAPVLSNSVYRDIMLITDLVVYCLTEDIEVEGQPETQYLGVCRPGTRYVAKDSFGLMPPRLVNPTFPRLLAYTTEKLKAGNDEMQQAAKRARQGAKTPTPPTPAKPAKGEAKPEAAAPATDTKKGN